MAGVKVHEQFFTKRNLTVRRKWCLLPAFDMKMNCQTTKCSARIHGMTSVWQRSCGFSVEQRKRLRVRKAKRQTKRKI